MAVPAAPDSSGRRSHRRVVLVYILAIVGPTLALLFLGLQAVRRQRQAVASLSVTNLRLSGERLAVEVERRVEQLAEACLGDGHIAGLVTGAGDALTPGQARQLRARLEEIEQRHPIADQLFLVRGDRVIYPMLQAPEPRPLEEDLAPSETRSGRRFATLFAEAERLELVEGRVSEALDSYRRCFELPVSDPAKALALARVARCAGKLEERKAAEAAYEELAQRFGDLSDGFHRPLALVAGLELYDLKRAEGEEERSRLVALHGDLLRGRWELSADQADYFLAQLRERAPGLPALERGTGYLRRLELARALHERFRPPAALRPGEMYGSSFLYDTRPYQLHYSLAATGNTPEVLIGLAVNLTWVETRLLPLAAADLGMAAGQTRVVPRGSAGSGSLQAGIPFPKLFPFWELSQEPAPGAPSRSWLRRDTAVFAGATLLVVCVLALGVLLLLRDVRRETQLNRLRSDFVSGVSHELKTPLTLVRLYTETLLEGDAFREEERQGLLPDHPARERAADPLDRTSARLRERGPPRKAIPPRGGRPRPLDRQTVQVYGEYLKRRGFAVEASLSPSLPPVVFDPDAVAQAVVNLLDNAAKYSGESKFVGVRLLSEDSAVVFEVEDRGIGIPAEEQDKIFRQFYRSGTRSGKGGYGLGLFLVRHIMDAHGGRVEVQSEAGQGSRFRLVFPLPSGNAQADEAS